MKKITNKYKIGYLYAEIISDIDQGKKLDSKIMINNDVLCWISGDQIDEFLFKINSLIAQYKI